MRVAHVNMSQDDASCPQGLTGKVKSGLTLCGQSAPGCQGALFSALGFSYSRVCGQLRGYQFGTTNAFGPYIINKSFQLNQTYVDGASITYDTRPPKHIWTYATGRMLGFWHFLHVHAIQAVLLRFLPLLVVTTTVRLVTMIIRHTILSFPMILCGMDSSVLVWRLPAVLTPTCHGSSRHSVRPPLRIFS